MGKAKSKIQMARDEFDLVDQVVKTDASQKSEVLHNALAEKVRRQMDPLRLYRPMPTQFPFHASQAMCRLVRGGNRSGKTTSAAVEFAAAARGIPLRDMQNNPIPFRYPTDRPLLMWVIGYDQRHIGGTIHRLLFRAGAIKMIKVNEEWVAYNPNLPEHYARRDKAKEAPPLIPAREIEDFSWEKKADFVFEKCILKTRWNPKLFPHGTEIHAFSSKAEPKQGDPVDFIWVDEDIYYPRHVGEWMARLPDRHGCLTWSVWPHTKNDALIRLSRSAEEQREEGRTDPIVEEIVLRFSDNPFIEADAKKQVIEGWANQGEHEVRTRDEGQFLTDVLTMYPNFAPVVHGIDLDDPRDQKPLTKAIRENGGGIPEDWSIYLILDPGHARPAVLFLAVPNPEAQVWPGGPYCGHHVIAYDEVFAKCTDAEETAKQVALKLGGRIPELMIIDSRAGRQTPMGFGKTVAQNYQEAFDAAGIKNHLLGSGFISGSDNVEAGILSVRSWLTIRKDGTPKLYVVTRNCVHLIKQMVSYRKHIEKEETVDRPATGQVDDLCDCIRYAAAYDPQWVHHPPGESPPGAAYKLFMEWTKNEREKRDSESVYMGAGVAVV